jgi:hypothetical protein
MFFILSAMSLVFWLTSMQCIGAGHTQENVVRFQVTVNDGELPSMTASYRQ